jgi:hypothetical protein
MKIPRINRHIPKDELLRDGFITKGLCDHEKKAIYINPYQSDKERLITGVHEMLHHIFPDHIEYNVERHSVLIGEVLWRLGYRSKEKDWKRVATSIK